MRLIEKNCGVSSRLLSYLFPTPNHCPTLSGPWLKGGVCAGQGARGCWQGGPLGVPLHLAFCGAEVEGKEGSGVDSGYCMGESAPPPPFLFFFIFCQEGRKRRPG